MNVKMHFLATSVVALSLAQGAYAHGDEKHDKTAMAPGRTTTGATVLVAPTAQDAVAVVERFSAAIGAGDVNGAAAQLDPNVLILESGGAERSKTEYMNEHAGSDAAFLKAAHVTLRRRVADTSGNLAWVASESEIHAMKGKEMLTISSSETMVLRKTGTTWKIVHIHWSSRRAGAR